MAKAKYKYRTKIKKVYSKSRGGGGSFKPFIDGGLAGIAGQIIQRWLGPWGHPLATAGIGYWRKNQTLQTEGARELGALVGTMLPMVGGGASPYGGGRNY